MKTQKHFCKALISAVLTAAIFSLSALPGVSGIEASAAKSDHNYTIVNPYREVDWDKWGAYKTQLHCHTNVSDGNIPLNEVIEEHYRLGYDILSITDHMTLGTRWDQAPKAVEVMRFIKRDRTKMAKIQPLASQRRDEIFNGVGRNGNGMLEITTGIELNGAVPSNSHVNGYFSDYGQSLIGIDGDYETPVAEVEARGGITFLDHLGNYTKAYTKNDPSISSDKFYVNKFSSIFINHRSCLGMGLASGTDTHTTYDRILYDNILQKTIPYGVVPWSFTFSDAHSEGEFDRAFTVHLMPELSVDAFRRSMESGAFFSVSRYARWEIAEDFVGEGAVPSVSRITVDDANDAITLEADNYNQISWVSNGKIIAVGASIDIDDYSDVVGSFVRAYLTGPGGICFVQPFMVSADSSTPNKEKIPFTFDYSFVLRQVVTFLDKVIGDNSIIRLAWYKLVGLN